MERQLRVALLLGAAGVVAAVGLLVPASAPKTATPKVEVADRPADRAPAPQPPTVIVVPTPAVGGGPPSGATNTGDNAQNAQPARQAATAEQGNVPAPLPAPTAAATTVGSAYSAPPAHPTNGVAQAAAPTTTTTATAAPTDTAAASATAPTPSTLDVPGGRAGMDAGAIGIPSTGGVTTTDAGVAYDPNLPFIAPVPVVPPTGGNGTGPAPAPTGGGRAGEVPPSQGGAGATPPGQGGAGAAPPSQGGAGAAPPGTGGAGGNPVSPRGAGGITPR